MPPSNEIDTPTWVEHRDGRDTLHVRTIRLEVVAGANRGLVETFGATTTVIGRSNADLRLDDRRVSTMHARIDLESGGSRLRDLGSKNGTHVGGMRVVDGFLDAGCIFVVGDTSIQFQPLAHSVELTLSKADHLERLIGKGVAMRRLYDRIERFAPSDITVLIDGETGSGKELVAAAIHARSKRFAGPYVIFDCAAVPPQLIEDHLFGHEQGAFTGAGSARRGVFEEAHGGTLFLDELGELPSDVQPKLLRAVETRTIQRLGSVRPIHCDARIVAATNRDLASEVNHGRFRPDLYFRIAAAVIHAPPLRAHREDIEVLVQHFVNQLDGGALPAGFVAWAIQQPWPGNVRELRAAVERAIVLDRFPELVAPVADPLQGVDASVPFKKLKRRVVDELERQYVSELLAAHGGNISAAARAAELDRMTLYKMLARVGVRAVED